MQFITLWNFSVSFYYCFLVAVKAVILYFENRWKWCQKEKVKTRRFWLFKIENIFLFLIDLALLAPITLMILQKKQSVSLGLIPTIASATYTTYKITMAILNYRHSKKTDNLTLHGLKVISLKEAIVSIITLQNTMVYEFGDAKQMFTLTAWTTAGMFVLLVAISITQFVKIKRQG